MAPGGQALPGPSAAAGRAWGLVLLTIAVAALLHFAPSLPLDDISPPLLASLHVVVKMLGAAIALAISLLTWNTRRGQPLNFVLAGFAIFAVAVLGAGQLVMLPGMPGLALAYDARVGVVLELGADSATVVALLAAALGPSRPGSARALRLGIALTAVGIAASISLAVGAARWSLGTGQAPGV
ncbi:MAG: hypothetical protein K2Y02_08190, partial [Burkholderiaceae bacterium]|nr:hypothetical protein [Burkholderiaceae bacterium]